MREVHKAIGLVADSEATVLILGETGTGKEVVARALPRPRARRGAAAPPPRDSLRLRGAPGRRRTSPPTATAARPGRRGCR